MNPLTQIKNTQKVTKQEIAAGVSESGSWHARFKHSAYIFAGGLPYQLTEGDLLAVFSQYGEIVDVNLVKDRETGKSRGFAFLAYEDQRSTVVAVDNLSGARIVGRTIRVDHVDNYKIKRAEVEGREVSDSDEDDGEEADEEAVARDAAAEAAELEGATVERIIPGSAAGTAGAEPWADKTSVLAALQEAGPMRPKRPHAEHDAEDPMSRMQLEEDEDPLLLMGTGKKAKKAKKEKKEKKKKDKEKKQREGKDTAKHQGSEAQGAAAMLRGKGEAAVAHAPPNGATHADEPRRTMPAQGNHDNTAEDVGPSRDHRGAHDSRDRHEREHTRDARRVDGREYDRHRERRHDQSRSHRDSGKSSERTTHRHRDDRL